MTYEQIASLLDYHYWARDRMFDALGSLTPEQWTRPVESSFRSIRDTAVHIWAAERVWCSRWQGSSLGALQSSDAFLNPELLRIAWQDLERDVRSVVHELGPLGLDRRFEYKTLGGKQQSSLFWHTLQHFVNHASYHRGQLTTLLRRVDATVPKNMDLITFYRDREVTLKAAGQTS
jgi:uncharacterized damage-inducible protein DinB